MHRLAAYIPAVATLLVLIGQASPVRADSKINVFEVSGTGAFGNFASLKHNQTWPAVPAGWSFARTYTSGGNTYLVLLRQHSGDLEIYSVSGSAIGSLVSTYNLRTWWTNAEVIAPGGVPTLVLHDADLGKVRTYPLGAGTLGAGSETTHSSWKGKNLFTTYQRGSTWYFYGLDTLTGGTALFTSTGTPVTTNSVTKGWTSVDFVVIGGNTYRVLYKGGDFPGNEGGRLAIDRVDANGNSDLSVYTESAAESREGWTTVKFYTVGANTYLLFYGASTSTLSNNLRIEQFNGSSLTSVAVTPLLDGWTDFDSYTSGGTTYMIALNEEGIERINGSEIDTIVQSVQSQLDATVPAGYQFAIAQSGRVLYEHAFGTQDINNPSVAMTVDVDMSLASLSKMLTAMSVLKLADMGELDLDNPQPNYIDYDADPGTNSGLAVAARYAQNTPRDYLLYISGVDGSRGDPSVSTYTGACAAASVNDAVAVTGCLGSPSSNQYCSTTNTATGGMLCPRSYSNEDYDILRQVIEYFSMTEGTVDFVDFVHDLWMDRVGMSEVDCMAPAGTQLMLHNCTAGTPCTSWSAAIQADSANCGSGGWKFTPRSALRFARAIRYQHVLGAELTEDLMSSAWVDGLGGATWLGWDGTRDDDTSSPERFFCKNGGAPPGTTTELCVGSKSVDLYVALNSDTDAPVPNINGLWLVTRYNTGN